MPLHRRPAQLDAVIFDLGGVLSVDPFGGFGDLERTWQLPKGWLAARFRGDPEFAAVERGLVPFVEFLRGVRTRARAEHGADIDLRALSAALESNRELRPEAPELLMALRQQGVRTALLTNNARESAGWRVAKLGHLLDVMVDSSEVGLRKPDPAIYSHAIRALTAAADRIGYVDDFDENLPPAAELGLRTHHFVTWTGLLMQLRAWGLALPGEAEGRPFR